MKRNRRTLIMMLAFVLCCTSLALTGCGEKAEEETPVNDTIEETAPQESGEEEDALDESVATTDSIDVDISCDAVYTYFDETEGYDRELNTSDYRSLKYIDYSLIKGDDMTLIALHFKRERQFTLTNLDGTENTEHYRIARDFAEIDIENTDFSFSVIQDVTNKDTGEKYEMELDEVSDAFFKIYDPKHLEFGIQQNILEWEEAQGLVCGQRVLEYVGEDPIYDIDPCAGDGWCFPNCYVERLMMENGEKDHVTLDDMGSPLDVYYFYELKNPTAPVIVTVKTGVFDRGDCAATSTKPVEQVMKIDIA
ncbi:MAG: hypothetical protein IJH77_00720 [Mogibacterium sp.]|nr:hypothetical protein [Mogibacterium sp.]